MKRREWRYLRDSEGRSTGTSFQLWFWGALHDADLLLRWARTPGQRSYAGRRYREAQANAIGWASRP